MELTEPEVDCNPELELLDDDVELEVDVEPVEAVAPDAVPGNVVALIKAKTPRAPNENIATPAVTWLIQRCAPSRADILDWTLCAFPMIKSSTPGLKQS